jgi:hypothetical protein
MEMISLILENDRVEKASNNNNLKEQVLRGLNKKKRKVPIWPADDVT